MRIRQPGRITENLWFLGCEESCVYLLKGDEESMIISGGMSYLVPYLLEQFAMFGIDETHVTRILILHSHFDHVGIVPFFKRRNHVLEIQASKRAWEILGEEKFLTTINKYSRVVSERMKRGSVYTRYDLDWDQGIIGTVVSEGDLVDLGNLEVHIYETPGHSSCAITAYVPKLKALFASDSAGIPYKNMILTFGNSNFITYLQSLERLRSLDVEYACADHYGYVAGDEVRSFIPETINQANEHLLKMVETYRRTKDIEATTRNLVNALYQDNQGYLLSPEITQDVYRQMVRRIAQTLQDS